MTTIECATLADCADRLGKLDADLIRESSAVELLVRKAQDEERDLEPGEVGKLREHRSRMIQLKDDIEATEATRVALQVSTRAAQIGDAISQASGQVPEYQGPPSLLVSTANLRSHAEAIGEGRTFGAIEDEIHTRATITAGNDTGARRDWATGTTGEPVHLVQFAGIPVSPLTGNAAQMPQYTLPGGVAGVAEAAAHAEYDAVDPVSLVTVRHGRWSKITSFVDSFNDLVGINYAHSVGIARDLDLAAVSGIETAAGTPTTFDADLGLAVRTATNTVAAAVNEDVQSLVIFGTPADIARLQDVTPANGGDAGSVVRAHAGPRLYPTVAGTAGFVTVFAPRAFRTWMTTTQSASTIDPTDGSRQFGQWLHATGVGAQFVGAAIRVDVVTG